MFFAGAWSGSGATDVPKFQDYPAKIYSGSVHAPDLLSDPEARSYRTRLRSAAKDQVNFSGSFVLTTWGCGTNCISGAILNAKAGEVIFHPHSICCWGEVDEVFKPIEIRPDSRLIIFSWFRNEEELMGAHFNEFRNNKFLFIKTVKTSAAQKETWDCRNETVEVSCSNGSCKNAQALTPMDVSVSLNGVMNVCAYSGCWKGEANSVRGVRPLFDIDQ